MRHVIPVVVTTTPAGYHQPRALALYREPRVDTYHHHPPPPPPPAAAAGAASCSCQQLCIQLACSVCHIPHAVPCAPTLTHDAKPGATRTVTRTMPYCSPSSQARQNQRSSRFTSPGPVRRPTSPDAVRMARDHSRSCMCHSQLRLTHSCRQGPLIGCDSPQPSRPVEEAHQLGRWRRTRLPRQTHSAPPGQPPGRVRVSVSVKVRARDGGRVGGGVGGRVGLGWP